MEIIGMWIGGFLVGFGVCGMLFGILINKCE